MDIVLRGASTGSKAKAKAKEVFDPDKASRALFCSRPGADMRSEGLARMRAGAGYGAMVGGSALGGQNLIGDSWSDSTGVDCSRLMWTGSCSGPLTKIERSRTTEPPSSIVACISSNSVKRTFN